MNRCLYCYQPLGVDGPSYHAACSRRMFGYPTPPVFPYSEAELETLASQVIQGQRVVTGVQPKLSLEISGGKYRQGEPRRFTLVGLWGGYILKPPSVHYPELPEVEDLTMHLAAAARIKTVSHSLIRLLDGRLAYVTRRVDRTKQGKLAMEDMCQLTERLTEDKYQGSYEQIGKAILKYSATPGLDLVDFLELVIFSFLTGNADMHLKNFSLLERPGLGMTLSPAYDLVNTALVNPTDNEDMALHLNGKKRRIRKQDFTAAMDALKLGKRQQENLFRKMERAIPVWLEWIDISLLSPAFKDRYKAIVHERWSRLQ